jgi:hypothetical protein
VADYYRHEVLGALSPEQRRAFLFGDYASLSPGAKEACLEIAEALGSGTLPPRFATHGDWARMNDVFVAARKNLSAVFDGHGLSADDPSATMKHPFETLGFELDHQKWSGTVTTSGYTFDFPNRESPSIRVSGPVVTLPMDGFRLLPPQLSGVAQKGADKTHAHAGAKWVLLENSLLASKLPDLRKFVLKYFGADPTKKSPVKCYLRQATAAQRVDLHFIKKSTCLLIKFEVMLPTHSGFCPEEDDDLSDAEGW